jgi:hypothetical protein
MDDRRPATAVRVETQAPEFKKGSELALAQPELFAPIAGEWEYGEGRREGALVITSRRTTRSFARKMAWPTVWFLAVLALLASLAPQVLRGRLADAFITCLWIMTPLLIALWSTTRTAFDRVECALSAERFEVAPELLCALDRGVTSVATKEIFGFGAQHVGSRSRLVVITRDGEVRLVRCNVLDIKHASVLVARLNRELDAIRNAAHYRSDGR